MRISFLIVSAVFISSSILSCKYDTKSNDTLALESFVYDALVIHDVKEIIEAKENSVDFIYDIGPRFSPIKREVIKNATTIDTFFDVYKLQEMEKLTSVRITIIENDEETEASEVGYMATFTERQLALLKASSYNTNFMIKAEYLKNNNRAGGLEQDYDSPYLTIVPEKQARYFLGKEVLKNYLRLESQDVIKNVVSEKLKPAKLYFTVNQNGAIENVRLDRSSGYPEVDTKMIEILKNVPGSWEPAKNINGKKVAQELVVSFGLMGC